MNRNLQILRVALWPMTKALLGLACGAVVVVTIADRGVCIYSHPCWPADGSDGVVPLPKDWAVGQGFSEAP
jgi:hypothetical protein